MNQEVNAKILVGAIASTASASRLAGNSPEATTRDLWLMIRAFLESLEHQIRDDERETTIQRISAANHALDRMMKS